MNLTVLVSTIDQGIEKVSGILQPELPDVNYIISHQYRDEKYKAIPVALNRRDLIVSQIPGKGLSRNRNNALQLAYGDIAIIADDDINYLPDAFGIIREVFENNPSVDIACFKIKTLDGQPVYKNYPNKQYCLNNGKKHSISSVELALRVKSVKVNQIRFDERFGLGSGIFQSGEESVFINDCIRSKLCVMFFPIYIVKHPYISSTRGIGPFDPKKNMLYGAIDAHKNHWFALVNLIFKVLRLLPSLLIRGKNPIAYFWQRLKGVMFILKSK